MELLCTTQHIFFYNTISFQVCVNFFVKERKRQEVEIEM